jgi:hypothetical protein
VSKPYYTTLNFTHFTTTYTSLQFTTLIYTSHPPPPLIPFRSPHLADLHPTSNSLPFTLPKTFLTFSVYILVFPALQIHFTSFITFQPLFLEILGFLLASNSLHITFQTLYLKVLDLEEKVHKGFISSLFQSWMVLLKKEYFPICVFCLLFLIFQSSPTLLR